MDTLKPSDTKNPELRHNVLLKALRNFQIRNQIEPNSSFGPITWSKMSQELFELGTGEKRKIYDKNLH